MSTIPENARIVKAVIELARLDTQRWFVFIATSEAGQTVIKTPVAVLRRAAIRPGSSCRRIRSRNGRGVGEAYGFVYLYGESRP